ncbi:alpha/beta fold hydrolase [Leptospira wolffii]|uniref:alpha/beta fold hydrolase n=1 Tax=Leptospira wolffii TaxID=409998 RepID=UPI00108434BB|nr:alpha/beta fold hydrolase [Leptospira wolffii]TGK62451.1 alpha/beta fold hydrolase [Leptospira wolffii]TGK65994.1 alpha/beta fold hydrolase [Leptospira wolffii]TGK74165.1 alpha/beta fold hydrolase [Leptospira wolffii]TGL29024.1 alpha/beta fold hydrolase [Leptospira wolffii]
MATATKKKKATNQSKSKKNLAPKPHPVSLEFTEEMKGFISLPGSFSYEEDYEAGKKAGNYLMFHLTIRIPDTEFFVYDPNETGEAIGWVECQALGGKFDVEKGIFNCFVDYGKPSVNEKHMRYRLFLKNKAGRKITLNGFKKVVDDGILNIWRDTSTLYTTVYEGHIEEKGEAKAKILGKGILRILEKDFLKQMTTFKSNGRTFSERKDAALRFGEMFLGNLWDIYGAQFRKAEPELWRERDIPVFTLEGVKDAKISHHPFVTEDKISVSLMRFQKKESKDVVVLMHGLTTSTDMFVMPEHKNLVTYLHENGYGDVWSFDWRGSLRFNYNLFPHRYTLDDIALYDVPAALRVVREAVGPGKRIHFVVHCVGSISFFMSLFAGKIEGVTSVVSNSVSLTPNVPAWSKIKLSFAPFLMESVLRFPNVNPRWHYLPGFASGKVLAKFVSLFHHECDEPACHMLSLMWGTGWPACYEHENLPDVTHRRVGDLFGATSMNYYRHIRKAVGRKSMIKFEPKDNRYDSLPNNYLDKASTVKTPILFMTGDQNKVFKDSNIIAHDTLNRLNPGNKNELFIAKGYGHQDTLMGKKSDKDIFPRIVEFLKKHS